MVSTNAEHLLKIKFSACWVRGLVSIHIDRAIASTTRRKPILLLPWPLPLHVSWPVGSLGHLSREVRKDAQGHLLWLSLSPGSLLCTKGNMKQLPLT